MQADVIIVGGGTAGCVLAARLSEDPRVQVVLIEAGPTDRHPLIHLPKGMATLLSNPRYTYFYPTTPENPGGKVEVLLRGRMLGGSSGINGMVYHRGQPADYDRWVELGLPGWGWRDMQPCFVAIENHVLPATEYRGRGGPLPIRVRQKLSPLSQALLASAQAHGMPFKEEPNLLEQIGAGPVAENIGPRCTRVSAARAFLTPAVRKRRNLTILTNTRVDRILFEKGRATRVECNTDGRRFQCQAQREVILSAGAIESPKILQLSGIGSPALLQEHGIPVVAASPGVGQNYRDHFAYFSQWRLRRHVDSENRHYEGLRRLTSAMRYRLTRDGAFSYGSHVLSMFADTLGTGRADAEFLFAPYSLGQRPGTQTIAIERDPGAHFFLFPLRGNSTGSLEITSARPEAPLKITPHYLATEHDRTILVDSVRLMRKLMTDQRLADFVLGEIGKQAQAKTGEEIIQAALTHGSSSYHTIGTCRMGPDGDPMAVLDARLKVRGVTGLRVVDCSVMPEQVSANTMGPVTAIAWRAADLIRADLQATA